MHYFTLISHAMILEILMMMMTMKLPELNKFLTLLMFYHLFHSSVVAQMSQFFPKGHRKRNCCENQSDSYGHFISATE